MFSITWAEPMRRLPKELTEKQQAFCRFVDSYQQRNGIGPTLDEIAAGMKLKGRSSARQHLKLVSKKGYVEYVPYSSRSVRLTDRWRQFLNRQFDQHTNPLVDVVADERPELFRGWTADEWAELRSVRGMGGAMTREAVVIEAEKINQNREARHKFEALLAAEATRQAVVAWIEEKYQEIDVKGWLRRQADLRTANT